MYSVWYHDGVKDILFVSDIPNRALADRIADNLADEFGAATAYVRKD